MKTQPVSSAPPGPTYHVLPEDVVQALNLIASILSLNDDPGIQPGQLQGMSTVLAHAENAWRELRADCPEC